MRGTAGPSPDVDRRRRRHARRVGPGRSRARTRARRRAPSRALVRPRRTRTGGGGRGDREAAADRDATGSTSTSTAADGPRGSERRTRPVTARGRGGRVDVDPWSRGRPATASPADRRVGRAAHDVDESTRRGWRRSEPGWTASRCARPAAGCASPGGGWPSGGWPDGRPGAVPTALLHAIPRDVSHRPTRAPSESVDVATSPRRGRRRSDRAVRRMWCVEWCGVRRPPMAPRERTDRGRRGTPMRPSCAGCVTSRAERGVEPPPSPPRALGSESTPNRSRDRVGGLGVG